MNWIKDHITLLALPYLFFASAMYHVGYWGHFNIDILNFLGLQDIINGLIFPLISSIALLFMIVIMTILLLLFTGLTKEWIKLPWWGKIICFILFSIIVFLINGKSVLIHNYYYPIVLFSCCMLFIVLISDMNRAKRVMIALCFFPLYTSLTGFVNGDNVKKGYEYQYIETKLLINQEGVEGYSKLIYLGKGGENFIFSTPDFKQNLIAKSESFKNIILKHYIKPDEGDGLLRKAHPIKP